MRASAITCRVYPVIGCMTWLAQITGTRARLAPAPTASASTWPTHGRPSASQGRVLITATTPTDGSADMTSMQRVKMAGSMTAAPVMSSGFCTVP